MPELDDVRLKEIDELTDEDKSLLKEKQSELTDEEKEAFKDVLGETGKEEELKFKSPEEFEEKVGGVISKVLDERAEKRKEAKLSRLPGKEERIFPKDYQPKDWEEAGERILSKAEERLEKKEATRNQQLQRIREGFSKEMVDIRKTNSNLPATGTPEGDEFEAELYEIGSKYKFTSLKDSFEVYNALKKKGDETGDDKQRSLAGKVSKGGGVPTPTKGRKYSDLASKSMDELLEEEMTKRGISE